MGSPINMISPEGDTVSIDEANVDVAIERGFRREDEAAAAARVKGAALDERYGGVVGGAVATVAGGARSVTGGSSDVVADQLGAGDDLRHFREINPGLSTIGETIGAVSGVGIAGRAAQLGKRITTVGEGASLTRKAVRAGAGFGAEGALQGIGSGISELALSDDPLTVERIGSVLSSSALLGGGLGAGAGVLGKFAERGILRAKSALDDAATRLGAGGTGEVADDLARLDKKGLDAAEQAERGVLAREQTAKRAAAADEIRAYHQAVDNANPFLVVEGEASAELAKANSRVRRALGNKAGLAENPQHVMDALQRQEQALAATLDNADDIAAKLAARNTKFATKLEQALAGKGDEITLSGPLARRAGQFDGVKVARGADHVIPREKAEAFLDALKTGGIKGSEDAAFASLPKLLEQNRALQQNIRGAIIPKAELTSARLGQIADARDALTAAGTRGSKGITDQLVHGTTFSAATGAFSAIPVVGQIPGLASLLGAKAASVVSDLLTGRLGKAAAETAARSSRAVSEFLDVGRKVAPAAPVIATKVLSNLRYGHDREAAEPTRKPTLAKAFTARARELREQTEYSPTGAPVMRPAARMAMATKLDPVRAWSPLIADRLETLAARRVEFLAGKLPRRPDIGGVPMGGPDTWQPSDMEMRQFARYAAAVEDPGGIEERLAAGTITPEDGEVMREVYPERYAALVQDIVTQLPALRKKLPYERRLALSMFADVSVDPSLDPEILNTLQATYTAEPGTDGGMQPPAPAPQFGSVKAAEPTPAQQRSG